MNDEFLDLEDYGIIGNQETCALIGRNGAVDWLDLPFLDSASVFGALLDPYRGGVFSVTPALKYHSVQRYSGNTNVLVTQFCTATGDARITDFMPPMQAHHEYRMLLRKIEGVHHHCVFDVTFRPRFDYGRVIPTVTCDGKTATSSHGDVGIAVHGAELIAARHEAKATIVVKEGETVWLVLTWGTPADAPKHEECESLLQSTVRFWTEWSGSRKGSDSVHEELSHNLAIRSGLALKLLLNPETGGIAAAATVGLPECVGGIRNWDYRFAWLRDASFTAQALFHLGYANEAKAYRQWVMGILRASKDLSMVKPLYALHESAKTEEGAVEALGGYRHSGPVRVGNLAVQQTQLDVYGEVVNTVYETLRYGEEVDTKVWDAVKRICAFLCEKWSDKDRGIWEMRTAPRNYVHSKLMCWVGLDRGIRICEEHGFDAPVAQWRQAREEIREAILRRGFSERLNSFVQSFESEELDATALLIPIHRFLPPKDPRVQGTIDAVWRGLSAGNGLLHRYRADDGIAGQDGAFILCSFWLVNALAVSRRTREADEVFRQMLRHAGPLGLYSEEIDPRDGRMIGNFPQAISHIGLINAALHLGIAKGRGHEGPPPQSEGGRHPGNKR